MEKSVQGVGYTLDTNLNRLLRKNSWCMMIEIVESVAERRRQVGSKEISLRNRQVGWRRKKRRFIKERTAFIISGHPSKKTQASHKVTIGDRIDLDSLVTDEFFLVRSIYLRKWFSKFNFHCHSDSSPDSSSEPIRFRLFTCHKLS